MTEGHLYHIYNRGINSDLIFLEEKNYDFFLKRLNEYLLPHIYLISYCLMPNHFHLIVKIKETGVLIDDMIDKNRITFLSRKSFQRFLRKLFKSY